jgi:hypothetical protein
METKMTIRTTLKSAIAAALMLAIAAQANAESAFGTLAGIEAEPMNAAEMEATQGRWYQGMSMNPTIAAAQYFAALPPAQQQAVSGFLANAQNGVDLRNAYYDQLFGISAHGGLANVLQGFDARVNLGLFQADPRSFPSPFPANTCAACSAGLSPLLGAFGMRLH